MKAIARLMRYIGKHNYPKSLTDEGYLIARTYAELPDESYPDSWEKVSELFTADQLRQAKVEVLREAASRAFCNADRYMLCGMANEIEKGELK